MTFKGLARGREISQSAEDLRERAEAAAGVLVDLGTGDGSFPYRFARENPDWLVVGFDATAENFAKQAARIGAKVSKGGVANLALLVSPVETLAGLDGLADRLTINFPWGTLQQGLVLAEPAILCPARTLCKAGARFDFWLNLQVFNDGALRDRLAFPEFNQAYLKDTLLPAYKAQGFRVDETRQLGEEALPIRTTWGQKLTLGSRRETFHICGQTV